MLAQVDWDNVMTAVVHLALDEEQSSILRDGAFDLSILESTTATRYDLLRGAKRLMLALEMQSSAIRDGQFTAWTSNWEQSWAAIIQIAQDQIKAAFLPSSATPEDSHLSIHRFTSVQEALCSRVQDALHQQALGQLRRRVPDTILSLTRRSWYSRQSMQGHGDALSPLDLKNVLKATHGSFMQVLSEEVLSALDFVFAKPLVMRLEECAAAAAKRAELDGRIEKLNAAWQLITRL